MTLAEAFRTPRAYTWPNSPRIALHAFTYLFPISVLAAAALQPWEDPKLLFFDVIVSAEVAPECCSVSYGFISQLGILIWTTTAASCLFGGLVMAMNGSSKDLFSFAITAGLLTGWLGIDDAFLLHEKVFPAVGIPQFVVLIVYCLTTLLYLIASWKILVRSDLVLLAAAGSAFVASVAIDVVLKTPNWVVLEDSFKFFGICCWASFHISTMLRLMTIEKPRHE